MTRSWGRSRSRVGLIRDVWVSHSMHLMGRVRYSPMKGTPSQSAVRLYTSLPHHFLQVEQSFSKLSLALLRPPSVLDLRRQCSGLW